MILTILYTGLSGCFNCEECGPTDDEPYVNLHFYRKSDLSPVSVAIREFNGRLGEEILYFQDTTSQFILPLSMSADSSMIILKYISSDNYELEITDTIEISYERIIETTPKNIVELSSQNTQVLIHTFDSLVLICKDTLGICNSNESTIQAFF